MIDKTKQILMTALTLALAVSLAACTASSKQADADLASNDSYSLNSTSRYGAPNMANASDESESAQNTARIIPEAALPGGNSGGGGGSGYVANDSDTGDNSTGSSVTEGRKITYWANVSTNTKNFDADYQAICDLITQSGGYVASEDFADYTSYGRNEGRRSRLSIRVPSKGYDSFMGQIVEIGDVTNVSKSSQDFTSEYYDVEARIEMLELRKERLMRYLVEADNASDIVEFERELANVLYALDRYNGYHRILDQLVDFATVDITLTELITPETIGKDGEPLGDRAGQAFGLSAKNVRRFLEDMVVFIAGAIPVLFMLAIVGTIIWGIARVTRKSRDELARKRVERKSARTQARQVVAPANADVAVTPANADAVVAPANADAVVAPAMSAASTPSDTSPQVSDSISVDKTGAEPSDES